MGCLKIFWVKGKCRGKNCDKIGSQLKVKMAGEGPGHAKEIRKKKPMWIIISFYHGYPPMVHLLEDNSQYVAHAWRKLSLFYKKKSSISWIEQIKQQRLLHTVAPIFELPFNISTKWLPFCRILQINATKHHKIITIKMINKY